MQQRPMTATVNLSLTPNVTVTTTSNAPKKDPNKDNGVKRYFGKELQNFPSQNKDNNLVPSKNFILKHSKQLSLDENFLSKITIEVPKQLSTPKRTNALYEVNPELEYIDDIYVNLLIEEKAFEYFRNYDYMMYQNELTPRIRAMLISYMVEISDLFQLKNKTLYLSVQLMDRLFAREKISRYYFQLVAISCLFVSSKYEEIYYPEIRDWLDIGGKKYTEENLKKMEELILFSLDFNLLPLHPFVFYEIVTHKLGIKQEDYYLGCLILEMAQYDYALLKFKASTICESVILLLVKLIKKKMEKKGFFNIDLESWVKVGFGGFINQNEEHLNKITECNRIICILMDNINDGLFRAVVKKYSKKEYCSVSDFSTFV